MASVKELIKELWAASACWWTATPSVRRLLERAAVTTDQYLTMVRTGTDMLQAEKQRAAKLEAQVRTLQDMLSRSEEAQGQRQDLLAEVERLSGDNETLRRHHQGVAEERDVYAGNLEANRKTINDLRGTVQALKNDRTKAYQELFRADKARKELEEALGRAARLLVPLEGVA